MAFDLLTLTVFFLSISLHEFAHAWTADRLGDPTARLEGRMTLNPFAHIDILGLFALIFFGFGWAKPVPVDLFNLKNQKKDNLLISFAGPVSQILAAVLLAGFLHFFNHFFLLTHLAIWINLFLIYFIKISLLLAFFNLLPLHPLDGFAVVLGLLPENLARQWEETKIYGTIFLLMLFFLPGRIFSISDIISLPADFLFRLLRIGG